MSGKDDFLNWSELDLDALLGDYTDDDFYVTDSCETSTDEETECKNKVVDEGAGRSGASLCVLGSVQKVQKETLQADSSTSSVRSCIYECPVCKKELRSISGFRGHVLKQHPDFNRLGFKVGDYRRARTSDISSTTSASSTNIDTEVLEKLSSPPATFLWTTSSFDNVFMSANRATWVEITKDSLLLLPQAAKGSSLIAYANQLISHCDALKNIPSIYTSLHSTFVNRNLVTQSDRDLLVIDLQSMRIRDETVLSFCDFVSQFVVVADISLSRQLYQIWLRKIVATIMSESVDQISKNTNTSSSSEAAPPLSVVDQNVLYHICGYMAMKVKTASQRYKKLQNLSGFISCLATKEPVESGHFVDQYKQWVDKQSRGGLMFPNPNFYLLVREFDTVFRMVVNAKGRKLDSFEKSFLQTAMADSFMVKFYWNKIVELAHEDEVRTLAIQDYLIGLFITVKGFAVARNERDRLTAVVRGKAEDRYKSNKSLRGKLKKKM